MLLPRSILQQLGPSSPNSGTAQHGLHHWVCRFHSTTRPLLALKAMNVCTSKKEP